MNNEITVSQLDPVTGITILVKTDRVEPYDQSANLVKINFSYDEIKRSLIPALIPIADEMKDEIRAKYKARAQVVLKLIEAIFD